MARIAVLEQGRASFISRALFWAARRRLGRLPESWEIMAHVPRLHLGRPDVDDELFTELERHFTNAQLVELTTEIALANFRGRFDRAHRCQPADLSAGAYCPVPQAPA